MKKKTPGPGQKSIFDYTSSIAETFWCFMCKLDVTIVQREGEDVLLSCGHKDIICSLRNLTQHKRELEREQ